ncbi:MAG: hypothetical protein ABIE23_02305 [archaeon]
MNQKILIALICLIGIILFSGCIEEKVEPEKTPQECLSDSDCEFFYTGLSVDSPCPSCYYADKEWVCINKNEAKRRMNKLLEDAYPDPSNRPPFLAACEACAGADWDQYTCKCINNNCIKTKTKEEALTISTDKTNYDIGEDINVTVTIKNNLDTDIWFIPSCSNFPLNLLKWNGTEWETWYPDIMLDCYFPPNANRIDSQKKVIYSIDLIARLAYTFGIREPGVYRFQNRYAKKEPKDFNSLEETFPFIASSSIFTTGNAKIPEEISIAENLKVSVEPVGAAMEEWGVYIFRRDEPFKIKVTLENTGEKDLNLLTPGKNDFNKVFYFQILEENGAVIRTDT